MPGITIPGIGDIQSIEDFIVSNNLLPLGSLLYVVFCVSRRGWGWDNFLAEADAGNGREIPALESRLAHVRAARTHYPHLRHGLRAEDHDVGGFGIAAWRSGLAQRFGVVRGIP